MDAKKLSAVTVGVVAGLVVVALLFFHSNRESPGESAPIRLVDEPTLDDSRYRSKTFSLAVADFNGDARDDILIGAHNENPFLLVNTGSGFSDQSSALFPAPLQDDRHGYTVADFDNDGRLDIAIASGGTDGVGEGWPNLLLHNESEGDALRLVAQPVGEAFALAAGRSRAFIPLPSSDGSAVDLYYATLARDGYDNRLFRNNGGVGATPFIADPAHFLSRTINDHGRGAIADLDGDGGLDYMVVQNDRVKIYWHRDGGASPANLTGSARSALLADFNNDGRLDVFVGRGSRVSRADRMTFAGDGMIFTLHKNSENDDSAVVFRAASDLLLFDLNQWVPTSQSQRLDTTEHIFLGAAGSHPPQRRFTVTSVDAAGQPEIATTPGIYIWHLPEHNTWHMRTVFPPHLDVFKGDVSGLGLEELARDNFHVTPTESVADEVFINTGGGQFTRLARAAPAHPGVTEGATAADFNSDGWLDVLGVRHGDQGDSNLAPFILTNLGVQPDGSVAFAEASIPLRERDRLHRADLVAHGFFDADDLPDAVITNGHGQIPGTNGVPRLLVNRTDHPGASLRVSLRGTTANRFGIGSAVRLYRGERLLGYRVAGLNINTSQDTAWLHFGLGGGVGPYRLVVAWPDGRESQHEIAGAGRVEIVQPE